MAVKINGDIIVKDGNKDLRNLKDISEKAKINNRNTTDTWIPVVRSGYLDYTLRKIPNAVTHTNHPTDQDCLATLNFLSHWNGAYHANGASNLTYCYQGTIQAKPKVLYNNSSGTNGTVTLNETAANFSYLEIYFYNNDNRYGSAKIFNPNGKNITLEVSSPFNNAMYFKGRTITINGTTLALTASTSYGTASVTSSTTVAGSQNQIYITAVIGYR